MTQMHYGTHASWIQQIMSGEDAIPRSIKTSCQALYQDLMSGAHQGRDALPGTSMKGIRDASGST